MFILILAYLLTCTGGLALAAWYMIDAALGSGNYMTTMVACAAIGGIGGCLYCLRAVYINKAVRKQWDTDWNVWYFLRPITSTITGGVSFVFLNAGLILLEAGTKADASHVGYFALAFIAGLNVDRFVARLEDLAEAAWGIEKSRMNKPERENTKDDSDH